MRPGEKLDRLEEIVREVPDLNSFINSPSLLEEYQAACLEAFGQRRFSPEAFTVIVEQLKDIVLRVPELSARLWSKTIPCGDFSIPVTCSSFGRTLHTENWTEYLNSWISSLALKAKPFQSNPKLVRASVKLSNTIKGFELITKSLPRAKRIQLERKFFEGLENDPHVHAMISALIHKSLGPNAVYGPLSSKNPDLILNDLRDLHLYPELITRATGGFDDLGGLVKAAIPTLKYFLSREDLFPRLSLRTANDNEFLAGISGKTTYHFLQAPRPFHALWKGILSRECCGGNFSALESTTPARWASIAIQGTRHFYVEADGKVLGWVHLVPVKRNGNEYDSLEFVGMGISRNVVFDWKRQTQSGPLLVPCLRELWKRKPEKVAGFVVGDYFTISTRNIAEQARTLNDFSVTTLKERHRFRIPDPLAKEINRSAVRNGCVKSYRNEMLIEATAYKSNRLAVVTGV